MVSITFNKNVERNKFLFHSGGKNVAVLVTIDCY